LEVINMPTKKELQSEVDDLRYKLKGLTDVSTERDIFKRIFRTMVYSCKTTIEGNGSTNEKCRKNGSYHFIPRELEENVRVLQEVDKFISSKGGNIARKKFLDAGCGIGNILMLARAIGFGGCYGLEFDDETLKIAKTLNRNEAVIKRRDILTFEKYSQYDVIYFYRPFCNDEKQMLFEEHLYSSMSVGAIVIPIYKQYHALVEDKKFKHIDGRRHGQAFIKVKEGQVKISRRKRW
jgi:SAM-dependent methyltransferase